MSENTAERELRERIESARLALNAVSWWRPLKRQDAADHYKYALLMGALWELRQARA